MDSNILDTILRELREINSKIDAILSNQGTKKSLTGITNKPTAESDFTGYVRELSKTHKQFPGLGLLTLESLQQYKAGSISIAIVLSSIGASYSKRNSFYNFLRDLSIVSSGKYNFIRERNSEVE